MASAAKSASAAPTLTSVAEQSLGQSCPRPSYFMKKDIHYLIDQIKYAKKLHMTELAYRIKEQKDTLKEKNFVLKIISLKRKPNKAEIEKVKKLVIKWRKTHYFWIDLVKKNKKWAKEGGGLAWQKKWIKIYDDILDYLARN